MAIRENERFSKFRKPRRNSPNIQKYAQSHLKTNAQRLLPSSKSSCLLEKYPSKMENTQF